MPIFQSGRRSVSDDNAWCRGKCYAKRKAKKKKKRKRRGRRLRRRDIVSGGAPQTSVERADDTAAGHLYYWQRERDGVCVEPVGFWRRFGLHTMIIIYDAIRVTWLAVSAPSCRVVANIIITFLCGVGTSRCVCDGFGRKKKKNDIVRKTNIYVT